MNSLFRLRRLIRVRTQVGRPRHLAPAPWWGVGPGAAAVGESGHVLVIPFTSIFKAQETAALTPVLQILQGTQELSEICRCGKSVVVDGAVPPVILDCFGEVLILAVDDGHLLFLA